MMSPDQVTMQDIPQDIERAYKTVDAAMSSAREMTQAMFNEALSSPEGFNSDILERLSVLDVEVEPGAPVDSQAIAEFLTYSHSPFSAAFESQVKSASSVVLRSLKLSALVIQAALAEQQNKDGSLKEGQVRFDVCALEQTIDDWVLRGAHRCGKEHTPLSQMAKAIDMSQTEPAGGIQARFGCVVPIVVSVHTWRLLREHEQVTESMVAMQSKNLQQEFA